MTPSIYWSIRSLPVFYSAQLATAISRGAGALPAIRDGEWPEEPEGGDSWDLSGVPEWLRYILVVDDLHEFGLRAVTKRRAPLQRGRRAEWFPSTTLFVKTIPERELDDPLDTNSSRSMGTGLIEELSEHSSAQRNKKDSISS